MSQLGYFHVFFQGVDAIRACAHLWKSQTPEDTLMQDSRRQRRSFAQRMDANEFVRIANWLTQAWRAVNEGSPRPDVRRLVENHDRAKVIGGDGIALLIKDPHQPRIFDVQIYLFMRLSIAFTGTVNLNPMEKSRGGQLYPYINYYAGRTEDGKSKKRAIRVDRITMDAQPGQIVRETSAEYRDRRFAMLRTASDSNANHNYQYQGRGAAVSWAIDAYNHASRVRKLPIDRADYQYLLESCLELLDFHRLRLV